MLLTAYFFGTFNPIHMGHLGMAQAALALPEIERVIFIPSPQPPHRLQDTDLAPALDRLAMVRLATAGNLGFAVSEIELRRTGLSYTVDTLALLHPESSDQRIPLIIGQDALAQLGSWKGADTLLARCHFLQAPRPGCEPVRDVSLNGNRVPLPSTQLLDLPPNAISASWVRKQQEKALPLRYCVPESVRLYIDWNALYTRNTIR